MGSTAVIASSIVRRYAAKNIIQSHSLLNKTSLPRVSVCNLNGAFSCPSRRHWIHSGSGSLVHTVQVFPAGSVESLFSNGILPEYAPTRNYLLQTRSFSRKGGQMGHHLQNLDEMAHRDSREEAQNRREAKKKNSKKARTAAHKNDSEADDDKRQGSDDEPAGESGEPMLPDADGVRAKMLRVVTDLERSFASVRGGQVSPELFDAVRVSAYGESAPLSSVGQVVVEDSQRVTIGCYDPSVAGDVRDAVRDMPGMNLNPYVEEGGSGVVIVPIPRVSAETRMEIVKEVGRQAEAGKQRVRRIRRESMDVVKKGKDGKIEGVSKDDAFRAGKEVEAVTEEVLAVLNGIVNQKQKSVMDD